MKTSKVIPYIIKGSMKREHVGNTEFEIRNTKQEETFRKFSQPNSPISKLCQEAAEDDLLRLFLFLKSHISYRPIEDYPVGLAYPLLVDYDKGFLNSIHEDPYKSKVDDTKKKRDETEKTVKDLSSRMMWKVFSVAFRDKQIQQKLKRKKLSVKDKEMDQLFENLVKRRTNQFKTIAKSFTDVYSSWYYMTEYYAPLIEAFNNVEEARKNLEVLSLASEKAEEISKNLSNSLSRLIAQRIIRIQTVSFCMECTLKKGFEPYSIGVKYPDKPSFPSTCKKCGGKTMFHALEIEVPHSFGPLFFENRITEFIIGYTLARSDQIKRIYIHKKVHVIEEKGPLHGVEVDVFAITKNDKIILIEVTTTKDLNKIWETVHKKEKVLEGFPYDALVFITPSFTMKKYPRLNKERIYGARHLLKIASHIEHLIEEISKT